MKYKNLVIIGTSHIARQSLREVKKIIEEEKPEIVAIELDRKRLTALLSKKKEKIRLRDIRRIGIKGYLFSLIGAWAEKKLGKYVGVSPGSEMLLAVKLAKKHKARIALIDQDIEITLKRFSKALTWREKWNFIADIFKGLVLRKKEIDFDLSKVPGEKIIKKMMIKVKKRYPSIYKVLITERNKVMAQNLAMIMQQNKEDKIVAVIGAGHEKEIIGLIKKELKKKEREMDITYSFSVSQ